MIFLFLRDVAESGKIKVGPKKRNGALELLGHLTVSNTYKEVKEGLKVTKCWCAITNPLWMINLYVHPRNTITMMIRLTIQPHGYGELANTIVVAASEGVIQGRDARFLLNYVLMVMPN